MSAPGCDHLVDIRTGFALSNGAYGGPRTDREFIEDGDESGRHRTTRLTRAGGQVFVTSRLNAGCGDPDGPCVSVEELSFRKKE